MRKNRHVNDILSTPKRLQPTASQQQVIGAARGGGDLACIAYAGSGKTGTATEIAHETGAQGYMVLFNRSARMDAKSRLPESVIAETGHSLAFKYVIERSNGYKRKIQGELNKGEADGGPRLTPALIHKALHIRLDPSWHISSPSVMAHLILATIQTFQLSSDKTIKETHIPENARSPALQMSENYEAASHLKASILQWAGEIWALMVNEKNNFPIEHDTYLKILQIRGVSIYSDIWLLDEYQDTSPAMANLIEQQDGQKIYIGDPFQAIYGWRGAIDAMEEPIKRGVPTYYLNESFRYNHQIAGLASLLLRSLGESVPVLGQNRPLYPVNESPFHTLIARNNISLLSYATEIIRSGKSLFIPGGLPKETLIKALSALALFEGRLEDVQIGALKQLRSWQDFLAFAKASPSPDYMALIQLVETHQAWIPDAIKKIGSGMFSKRPTTSATLTTAHRAKGRQWPYVTLHPDLAISDQVMSKLISNELLTTNEKEQVNLLYVAITRCQLGITLPSTVKKNFQQLSEHFQKGSDTPETFCAKITTTLPENLANQVQHHRTQAFIKAHRKTD